MPYICQDKEEILVLAAWYLCLPPVTSLPTNIRWWNKHWRTVNRKVSMPPPSPELCSISVETRWWFGAGSVISVLTTCDFSANKHPLVKQLHWCRCPGWSESLPGAHAILLVLSCDGSYGFFAYLGVLAISGFLGTIRPQCKMSHLMTKPTIWLCAQRRLRSA